jgi:hypothetical protein
MGTFVLLLPSYEPLEERLVSEYSLKAWISLKELTIIHFLQDKGSVTDSNRKKIAQHA